MADRFISDTTTSFQLGQTVIAKVTNLDEEKRRFLVTLKISEVISPAGDVLTRLVNGLQERKAVTEMLSVRGKITLTYGVWVESQVWNDGNHHHHHLTVNVFTVRWQWASSAAGWTVCRPEAETDREHGGGQQRHVCVWRPARRNHTGDQAPRHGYVVYPHSHDRTEWN